MAKIRLHEKALAHLSRGLYRSPASALRELVSNAWDANATQVRINMNYPNFYQIVVEDNGEGFTKQEFKELMSGGIGNSTKRPIDKKLINNRPIIGRLGIGMLGIAQICGAFTITSKPKDGREGFRAKVRLYDLLKARLDDNDSDLVHIGRYKEVDVGEYDFDNTFNLNKAKHGTTIITDDIHPTFVDSFQKSLIFCKEKPAFDWKKNLSVFSKVRSLQEMGDYWRLLWELAASCPIPYFDDHALPESLIKEDQKRLLNYNFNVNFDNINLRKPVYLKSNPNGYTTKLIDMQEFSIYDRRLAFHGYIVVQEGAQLRPDELRGIMLRVKNVGIGYYDTSMLDYRINEGPRSRWLTGEIYVDEGLEDALNIDRDSFNRFHPEFRAIQTYVHDVLQKDIFPKVYKQIEIRSVRKAELKKVERSKHLDRIISSSTKVQEPKQKVLFDEVKIKDEALTTKKSYKDLATAIITIFDIALKENNSEKKRSLFVKLLTELLSKW